MLAESSRSPVVVPRKWLLPVLALVAAGIALRLSFDVQPRTALTLPGLLFRSLWAVVIPFLAALGAFRLAGRLLGVAWEPRAAIRWACCALWIVPVMVLYARRSESLPVAAILLLVSITAAARRYRAEREPDEASPLPGHPFRVIEAEGWHARFAGALGTALAAELAVVGCLAGRTGLGLALGAAALSVFAWRSAGAFREQAPWRRPALAGALVFLSVWIALFPFLRLPRGTMGSSLNWAVSAVLGLVRPPAAAVLSEGRSKVDRRAYDSALGEDYPGIIVYPELAAHTVLVAPPRVMARGLRGPRAAAEQSIPFFGVYWFYRFPQNRPPDSSITMRSDTTRRRFFTLDGTPLNQEARQNLGIEVTLAGCREIAIDVRSAETRRVWLDLTLVDTTAAGEPKLLLGRQLLLPDAATARLHWTLPRPVELNRFNEFRVRFHRQFGFGARSAQIAIERFVLVA